MTNFNSSELNDPQPPVPGERERALVAARAHELGRRRRLVQGGGALALVAALAVSVAALTAGGSSGPGSRVEAAGASADTTASAPTTQALTPTTIVATTVPAPAPDTAPAAEAEAQTPPAVEETAPVAPVEELAPTTFSVSGTVTGAPAGTTVSITFNGSGGTFTATADGSGNYSVSGLPAGDYVVVGRGSPAPTTPPPPQKFGTVNGDQQQHGELLLPQLDATWGRPTRTRPIAPPCRSRPRPALRIWAGRFAGRIPAVAAPLVHPLRYGFGRGASGPNPATCVEVSELFAHFDAGMRSALRFGEDGEAELLELGRVDRGGRAGQRVGARLGLGERDDLADVLLPRQDRRRAGRCRTRTRRAAGRRSGRRRAGSRSATAPPPREMPSSEKICCCRSGRWIRTLPEPSSQPLSTRS